MLKKLISAVLISATVAGCALPVRATNTNEIYPLPFADSSLENLGAVRSFSTVEVYAGLDRLRKKFPNGKYWNHYGSVKANPDGYTSTPCPTGHYLNGVQQCNGQCDGFAKKLGVELFGTDVLRWSVTSGKFDINSLCVGDIIRYQNKHTIMVVGFTLSTNEFIVADCNWDYHCGISWDRIFPISKYIRSGADVNAIYHYQGNSLTRAKYLADPPAGVYGEISAKHDYYCVCVGDKIKIDCNVFPARDASSLTYSSLSPTVATVDSTGYVTGISEGTTTIDINSKSGGWTYVDIIVTPRVQTERIFGQSRIDTAVEIAKKGWLSSGADNVILANGFTFADALAGVPLSKALDAPILLTENKNSTLEQTNLDVIKSLGAKNIYILGGEYVVSPNIESTLRDKGLGVERICGQSRFGTSVAIAEKLENLAGVPTTAFLSNGFSFADVLSVSTAAALEGSPILYTEKDGTLENTVKSHIKKRKPAEVVLIGGIYVNSEDNISTLKSCGAGNVSRLAGQSRYDTCCEIFKKYAHIFDGHSVSIATGTSFPDALSGGALSAKLGVPLILAGGCPDNPSDDMITALAERDIDKAYIFGGPNAVSDWEMYFYTQNDPYIKWFIGW